MAELFLGESTGAHGFAKTVVIKRILPHLAADNEFTKMFIAEAKITARLDHPKIAQTFDLGKEKGQLFIAMEYIDGIDVLAMLRECNARRVRVPVELSVYILHEVLDALDFAHKQYGEDGKSLGIVHRDISPSNVLLSTRGDVKLVDFGIAHAAHEGKTNSGALKGKYGYMSPEQVLGLEIDARSDLFSSGVLLAEMLMGRRLFTAGNDLDVLMKVRDVNLERFETYGKHIEPDLKKLVLKALSKKPEERYKDAADFRDHLDEWLFEHRHRIGTRNVAEVVEALYKDANETRLQKLGGVDSKVEIISVPGGTASKAARKKRDSAYKQPANEPSKEIEITGLKEQKSPTLEKRNTRELSLCEANLEIELGIADEVEVSQSEERANSKGSHTNDEASEDKGAVSVHFLANEQNEVTEQYDIDDFLILSEDDCTTAGKGERPSRLPTVEEIANTPTPEPALPLPPTKKPTMKGDLKLEPILSVVFKLTDAKKTGMLTVSIGGIEKSIYFENGCPMFVTSNIASELFGSFLVREGELTSGELDMCLAMMPHFGGKLGEALVGLELMKPLDVFRNLTKQVRAKLMDVCTWTAGQYAWFDGVKGPADAFNLNLDPFEVYGAAVKTMKVEPLTRWFKRSSAKKIKPNLESKIVPELFQYGSVLSATRRDFTNDMSLEETMTQYEADQKLERLQCIYLLANTGIVELH